MMSRYASKNAKPQTAESALSQFRTRYLLEVKAAYVEHYEEGLMSADSLLILESSINEALDRTETELYDWEFLQGLRQTGCFFRTGMRWQQSCCIGPLIHRFVFYNVQ